MQKYSGVRYSGSKNKIRVLFETALDCRDGYGYAAQELILAMNKEHNVTIKPIPMWFSWEHMKEETQELLNKSTMGNYDTHVIFFYPTATIEAKKRIAFNITMYEASRLPTEWVKVIDKRNIPILAPSKFVHQMFIDSGVSVPVEHLPFGIDTEFWKMKPRSRPKDRPLRFLIVGKLEPRKNTLFMVKAFQRAFVQKEEVQLVIKTREGFLDSDVKKAIHRDNRVRVVSQTLDEKTLRSMYYDCDVFIYCSRGEGFSFPPRFAIATGMPTLVTAWSALEEIPRAIQVPITGLSPMPPCGFSYGEEKDLLMADVDEEALIDRMRKVYADYNEYAGYVSDLVEMSTWENTVEEFERIYKKYE